MNQNNQISRRLILLTAAVVPLSGCVAGSDDPGALGLAGAKRALDLSRAKPLDTSTINSTRFKLDLLSGQGQDAASNWYSVSGGTAILQATGEATGADRVALTQVGGVEFSEIVVVGPLVKGETRAELLTILNSWATGEGRRFRAKLTLLDANEEPVRTLNLFDCIPLDYVPPSVRAGDDSLLEERFTFKALRIEG